jgi:hypothetical protein
MPLVAYGGGGEMTATKEFQGADVRPEVEDWLGTWPHMSWASKAHGIRYHLDKSEVNRMVVASFIKNCVGFLYVDNPGRVGPRKIPVGTGFFVTVENRYGNGVNYLVTAKHVWEELNDHPPGYVRLNRKDPPSEEWGARNLPLKGNWVFHADENVDLAVLPWAPDTADLILESWDIVKFCAAEDSERRKSGLAWPPTEGTPVLFAAMMPNYTGRERNYPIVRGRPASSSSFRMVIRSRRDGGGAAAAEGGVSDRRSLGIWVCARRSNGPRQERPAHLPRRLVKL